MRKSLKIFKRIMCVLGILFIVLGAVPIPEVSQVSEVSAETLSLPSFSSVNLFDSLSEDGEEPPLEEPPAGDEGGDECEGDGCEGADPPDDGDGGECEGEECGGEDSGGDGEGGECEGEGCEGADPPGGDGEDEDCEGEDCPEILGLQTMHHPSCQHEGERCDGFWGDCCNDLSCESGRCVDSCPS